MAAENPEHTSSGDHLLRRIEDMDISTYPALQAAFSILLAAYRSQHESFEILRARWAKERQVICDYSVILQFVGYA